MKSLFEPAVWDETVRRLEALEPTAVRQWGTMSASQMLEHCARAAEMAIGRGPQRQMFLGKLLGWMFRKDFLGEKPFGKNGPTGPDFIVKDEPDFARTRARLLGVLRELNAKGERGCDGNVHGFFGRMSGRDWGVTQYKHLDHHLRQFGA